MTRNTENELVAEAFDKTDGEKLADIYALEAAQECEDAWWIEVKYTDEYMEAGV